MASMFRQSVVVLLPVAAGLWLTGCASDDPPQDDPDTRPRFDQILSPKGSKPNDAYTKRSRYDKQAFRSRSVGQQAYAGADRDDRAREGEKTYTKAGGLRARWAGQSSRFEEQDAREGGQTARTFGSRFDNQEARTQEFGGARDTFRTADARESGDGYYTGRRRAFSTRTLGATQLSPNAGETASLYPAQSGAPLNEEDVRRVLNKSPRDR